MALVSGVGEGGVLPAVVRYIVTEGVFMISRLRLVAAVSAAFVLLAAAPALALHSWGVYHWPSGNLSPTVTGSTTLAIIQDVVNDWRGLETDIQPTPAGSSGGDIRVVAKRANPNWIGMAQIKVDAAGHILEGKVTLNSLHDDITLTNGSTTASIWEHVLCQEIGHVLGLTHDGEDTCMNDSFATLGLYPTTGGHDAAQLDDIYDGHSEGGSSPEPDNGGGPDCDTNKKAKKCRADAGQWITVHVFTVPASVSGR